MINDELHPRSGPSHPASQSIKTANREAIVEISVVQLDVFLRRNEVSDSSGDGTRSSPSIVVDRTTNLNSGRSVSSLLVILIDNKAGPASGTPAISESNQYPCSPATPFFASWLDVIHYKHGTDNCRDVRCTRVYSRSPGTLFHPLPLAQPVFDSARSWHSIFNL